VKVGPQGGWAAALVFATFLSVASANAQQVPDAGRVLKEMAPPVLGTPRPSVPLEIERSAEGEAQPGGLRVTLREVRITGNTVFTDDELLAHLGKVVGASFDIVGLQQLARRLTEFYHAQGYPLARAVLPPQNLSTGRLTIEVLEGRYGRVAATGPLGEVAQGFLAELTPGAVIASGPLERAVLVLGDQPGVRVTPVLRPGQAVGTGDLEVRVDPGPRIQGELGADNYGNRFLGPWRARALLQGNRLFTFGDALTLRGVGAVAEEARVWEAVGFWQGTVSYGLPLGQSGLRGQVSYDAVGYRLRKEFAALGASGTIQTASLGLAYPMVRRERGSLTLAWAYQYRDLEDRVEATATRDRKHSDRGPVSLQFDWREASAVTWGTLSATPAWLRLGAGLEAADRASRMDTRGFYALANADLARLQQTPVAALTLYGRVVGQWALKNLDSSETFLLGGPYAVRAYPLGEGAGDAGWAVQLEARWRVAVVEPFGFYDTGQVWINADNRRLVTPVAQNRRTLGGGGVGLLWQYGGGSAEATAAWRTQGGPPTSDPKSHEPQVWLTAGWRF
jgi:hemolysin activation/secretion protein